MPLHPPNTPARPWQRLAFFSAWAALAAWLLWCDWCLYRHALPAQPAGALAAWPVLALQVWALSALWRYGRRRRGYLAWALALLRERRGGMEWALALAPALALLASPFMLAHSLDFGDANVYAERLNQPVRVWRCAMPCGAPAPNAQPLPGPLR